MKGEAKACVVRDIKKVDTNDFDKISRVLSALSNKTRIAILSIMTKYGEVCACDLQPALGMPQSTITVHLRKMYDIGLLKLTEKWRFSYYSINPEFEHLIISLLGNEINRINDIKRKRGDLNENEK